MGLGADRDWDMVVQEAYLPWEQAPLQVEEAVPHVED